MINTSPKVLKSKLNKKGFNITLRISKPNPSPGKTQTGNKNTFLEPELCFYRIEYGDETEKGEEVEIFVRIDFSCKTPEKTF